MTLPHDTFYWHCHHKVLCEFVTDPQQRIDYIERFKADNEIGIRLKLFQPVQGKVPAAIIKAEDDYNKAWTALDNAEAVYINTGSGYDWEVFLKAVLHKATADYGAANRSKELELLHAKECPDCPWNGYTIFPKDVK